MTRFAPVLALLVLVGFVADVRAQAPTTAPGAPQTKDGVVQSVDAEAKTFVLMRDPRPLTFKTDDKTEFTLDGKPSTFSAAVKAGVKAKVTYIRSGQDRLAVKVEVSPAAPQ